MNIEDLPGFIQAAGSKRQAARLLGISPRTLDRRLRRLKTTQVYTKQSESDKILELQRINRELVRENLDAQEIRRFFFQLDYEPKTPEWLSSPPGSVSAGVPTLMLSDLHWGEVVSANETGQMNKFNMEIARERLHRTIDNCIDFCFNHINMGPVPGLVLILGGDMMSGDIHDELSQTNDEPMLKVLFDLCDNLVEAINKLKAKFKRLFIVTTFGNHGRTTRKPQYKNAAFTNLDWVLYNMLNRQFKSDRNVKFLISDSPDTVYSIYGTTYLLTHGDRLGTNGGDGQIGILGPVSRGVRKIVAQYADAGQKVDCVVMGHFHQLTWLPHSIINGSLKGYDEFAMAHRFEPEEAQQAMWFTHPKRGITMRTPIFCEVAETPEEKSWVAWQE